MDKVFSDRIADVPRSFIREILKVALDRNVISFAGGLPNRELFPADELKQATEKVFETYGRDVFQYSNSEGFGKLREYISAQYREKKNIDIPVDNILITSGSQQGLDLLGKIFLNEWEGLIIEEPGYLGAIQAFSIYRPMFLPVPVSDDGMDVIKLQEAVNSHNPKMMYTVPNFQNPSGISYSIKNRMDVAEVIQGSKLILIEDDPYGDLRFSGEAKPSFKELAPDNTVLLGSFSKSIVPGFRLGWIVAPEPIMSKLVTAKQATDLHTTHFTQCIIYQYLMDYDIDKHIEKINHVYGNQCKAMLRSIKKYFPGDVTSTTPEGGMFLWAELPEPLAALDLFDLAVKDHVVFVPGDPFYINKTRTRTMRLNFSCVDEATIETGIMRLANAINVLQEKNGQAM
ncbi:PLP-dependent aminotransferase family protein [candidate division KSB1 bacterium]|nr:PLP-dependent aminotransferase family protein [candidate division KSB1 bacterium]